MCRFVAYTGQKEIFIKDLLKDPEHSLIKQSHGAREGTHGVNADGFGMAWYDSTIGVTPGIFKTIQPAWNDSNLKHLCNKIQSNCFLAHIRASTVGDVTKTNCHPFYYDKYSFVHNGTIRKFSKIKLRLLNYIKENLFLEIKGNTDSECFFFLVVHYLKNANCSSLIEAVRKAFQWISDAQSDEDIENFSRLNIAISDGNELVATRCVVQNDDALSLYYVKQDGAFVIASEPLDDISNKWKEVPKNHYLRVKNGKESEVAPI
ncbi:MAG TPA: class II glutamine amidotransferase [Candidatus Megaira endosymbiont of Nemacystus decipiens]|nr:class II glutamine amidotransferase [Candidatus Megaera endosymbiont of Nemacystus decipiens]